MSGKNRGKNGRFVAGNCANPSGRNGRIEVKTLMEALDKEGSKRGTDFWSYVARRTYTNNQVLMVILKKILPDKIEGEGFDSKNLTQMFSGLTARGLREFVDSISARSGDRISQKGPVQSD